MYNSIAIVGPPTHFPLGLGDFLNSYPEVEITLCHPDYDHLSKYFFGQMVEDIIQNTSNLKVWIHEEPPDADLTIVVTDGTKFSSNKKLIYWPKENGSVDMRQFIKKKSISSSYNEKKSTSSSTREKKIFTSSEYFNIFSPGSLKLPHPLTDKQEVLVRHIIKDVTGVLLANKPCLSEMTYPYVLSDDVCDILDWFNQFCEENGLQQDAISIHYLLEMGLSWPDLMTRKKLK